MFEKGLMDLALSKYTKEELREVIKELYPSPDYGILRTALIKAMAYLPRQDVDNLLNLSVIYIQGNISRRFDRDLICGMSAIILSIEDLMSEKFCIPSILHESAHEILNHTEVNTLDEYKKQEDEAWSKVREWLPDDLHGLVDELEKEGGGTKGHEVKKIRT